MTRKAFHAGVMSLARVELLATVLFATLGALPSAALAGALTQPAGNKLITPFDFQGVTLDGGRLRAQVEEVRDYYLHIANDDLLKGFRQRAGKPAPGNTLRGWYSNDTFHVFGQIVSGLARLHAATGDPACRDKVNSLLTEWGKCIEPDGYFFYSRKPNAPHYIYDKMMWGLLDAYVHCGNQEALGYLSRITDWAIKNLEHTRQLGHTGSEWYTLSENLYRAYLITGDQKYREFAQVWEYSEYWDIYGRKDDIFAPRPDGKQTLGYHAYSHVNTLGGAGAAYLVTGSTRYLDILKNAYAYLQDQQVFVTGGYGPGERLLPHEPLLGRLYGMAQTFETQCGSWAAFKMARYLMCFTGDARYGDWVERLVYNGIGASIPMTADGRVFYYSDYQVDGAEKQNIDAAWCWSCCTGTRPQAIADYYDQVWFKDPASLYVNLFTPSTVKWTTRGRSVAVRQTTRFPEEAAAQFALSVDQPAEFTIKIRNPQWLAEPMSATVNGQAVSLTVDSLHWAVVRRKWKNGDRLAITLPMRLAASSFDAPRPYPAAIQYGPVVLAFQAPGSSPFEKLDLHHPDRSLLPVAGEALTWQLTGESAVRARPFYAYREGEPYFLYFDPTAGQDTTHQRVRFKSRWNETDKFRFSNVVGATAQYAFEGTGIQWLGFKFDDAGRAEVAIDDKIVAVVDQYGPGRNLPFSWSTAGLVPGKHTIQIKIIEEKSDQSKNRFINVAGFKVTPAAQSAADRITEASPIPGGIYIRIRPLSNRGKRSEPAHWDSTNYNARQILAMIADLKPNVLERYTDGRLDPDALVPVAPGEPPMNVRQFLDASIRAGAPGCLITPRLTLEEFDKGTLFTTAQNLYDFPMDSPMRILSLDNWSDFSGSHTPEQIREMFQRLKAQGWQHFAVNMVGGLHDAQGFAAVAEFGIKRELGFAPNLDKLQRMKADPSIKKHLLYIDFPQQATDFMKLTPDQRAEALVTRIAAVQQKEGFTFVWPILQGVWDSTQIYTTRGGRYGGASLYEVMKAAMREYPPPPAGMQEAIQPRK